MRKIEEKILDKINGNITGNITGIWQLSQRDRVQVDVQVDEVSKKYFLWNNCIYFVKNSKEYFSFCSYTSQTTKSRLNALVKEGKFYQKDFNIYFVSNNKTYLIDPKKTYSIHSNSLYLLKRKGLEEQVKEI